MSETIANITQEASLVEQPRDEKCSSDINVDSDDAEVHVATNSQEAELDLSLKSSNIVLNLSKPAEDAPNEDQRREHDVQSTAEDLSGRQTESKDSTDLDETSQPLLVPRNEISYENKIPNEEESKKSSEDDERSITDENVGENLSKNGLDEKSSLSDETNFGKQCDNGDNDVGEPKSPLSEVEKSEECVTNDETSKVSYKKDDLENLPENLAQDLSSKDSNEREISNVESERKDTDKVIDTDEKLPDSPNSPDPPNSPLDKNKDSDKNIENTNEESEAEKCTQDEGCLSEAQENVSEKNSDDKNVSNEEDKNGVDEMSDVEESEPFEESVEEEEEDIITSEIITSNTVTDSCRKRRRIICYDEDQSSDEENNDQEQVLAASKSPTPEVQLPEIPPEPEPIPLPNLAEVAIKMDKPGPKSKKASTIMMKELQARTLLQTAVVIPIVEKPKKRRKLVIDSDDDDDFMPGVPFTTSLDDIGAETEGVENASESFGEPVEEGEALTIIENAPVECTEDNEEFDSSEEDKSGSEMGSDDSDNQSDVEQEHTGDEGNEPIAAIKSKKEDEDDEHMERDLKKESTGFLKVKHFDELSSGKKNAADKIVERNVRRIKTEPKFEARNHPPSHSTNNRRNVSIHNKRPINDDPFEVFSSSSEEEEHIPNEVYFGASGANIIHSHRGKSKTIMKNRRKAASSESDHEKYITLQKQSRPDLHMGSFAKPKKRKKKRELPNDIYFGDVQVPLHELYAYENKSSSEDEPDTKPQRRAPSPYRRVERKLIKHEQTVHRIKVVKIPAQRGRPPSHHHHQPATETSPKKNNLSRMKQFLKAAGMKRLKYQDIYKGCKNQNERAEKILEYLHKAGLEGKPTIAKCKQLKEDLRIRKEIEELDKGVIIQAEGEGRLRRSTRNTSPRNYSLDVDYEAQATLKKIKQIIDSDSD